MTKSRFDTAADALSPPYNLYRGRDTRPYGIVFDDPSLTKQEFAEECDINVLMKKYEQTGLFPQSPGAKPFYVDNTDLPSYQEAHNLLIEAGEAFNRLPASVRREFDNDPAKFVQFAMDDNPDHADRLEKWGMLSPEAVAARRAAAEMAADDKAVPSPAPAPAPKPAEKAGD